MSLKVWLPFNRNFDNYGFSETHCVTTISSSPTISTNGKFGSCYSFDGTDDYIHLFIPYFDVINGNTELSIAFWCKPTNSDLTGLFTVRKNSSHQISLYSTGLYFRDSNHSSLTSFQFEQPTSGVWSHYAIIYDNGSWIIYKNGLEIKRQIYSSASLNTNIEEIRIGIYQSSSGNIYYCGLLNDFRIYDHALSAKEVKEISKGLVLHYTMDENVQQLNNCFNYPTFNTSSASGGWLHWAPSGSTGSYSQNTDKTYIYNKNQTYSHKVSHLTGTYYICYQSPAFEGGFRSVQAIIKLEDGSHPEGKVSFSHNANVLNKPTEYIELGDGFYLMRKQGFKQDGSNDLVSIYLANNAVVYISEAYLENDREVCSDILSLRSTIEHDTSGYCNDGVITGTLTLSTDTPRNKLSTFISNGLTEYIKTPTINIAGDAITVSMWINSTNTTPTGDYHMPFQSNTNNYVEFSITKSGLFRCGLYVNGTRYVTNISNVNVLDGNWHMLSVTYDGANIKRYIDGILKSTTAISGTLNCTSQLYWIGRRSSTTYAALDMYFSDIRMYTTALSEEEIKELYDTAAYIDNTGNISCYEFEEQNENLLKYEYTLLNTNTASACANTRGKYTYRNGEVAMAFQAKDTYFASGDDRNSLLLYGFFKENTRYVFDLWLDVDDIISGNVNRVGGFSVRYTDGTSSTALNATGTTGSQVGWIHKVFISAAGKSVKSLTIPYYTSIPFFVRADSFITPLYDTKINKNGVIDTSQFIENTDVAFIGTGDVNSNKFLEI